MLAASSELVAGEDRNHLLAKNIVAVIAAMLQLAAPVETCESPFASAEVVVKTILSLPGRSDREDNERILQTQVNLFPACGLSWNLLVFHGHM